MPEPGRAERIVFLRTAITRIEAGGKAAAGPAIGAPSPQPAAFYEIAPSGAGDMGAAAGFTLMLAGQLVRHLRRPLLWVAEDFALTEHGAPYAPGLCAYGIGTGDFVLIRARNRLDLWRTMEEALKARAFAAVVGEPAALSGRDLPGYVRRLAINARSHHACAFLLRPPAQVPFLAPSPLRFEVTARPSPAEHLLPGTLAKPSPAINLPASPGWQVHYRGAPG